MSEEQIVTLRAEEGNKPGQPIATHTTGKRGRFLVFLPSSAKAGQDVRVRLVDTGKQDSRGCTLYRGEPAPVEYTERWKDNADGTTSRVTISTNWLIEELEEGVLETRPLAKRDGRPWTKDNFEMIWGNDLSSSIVEDRSVNLIPLEEEKVEGGQIVWRKVGEREEALPVQHYPLKRISVGDCSWKHNRFHPIYNPDWAVLGSVFFDRNGSELQRPLQSTWSQMPSGWRSEQEAQYPICSCGRQRRDVQVFDSYGKCETCRGEEHCIRCNKQTKVTLTGGNLVCDVCKPIEDLEQLIKRTLTADHKSAIAAEARRLQTGEAYAKQEGMVILGATLDHIQSWTRDNILRKWADYDWFYFCKEGIYGSKLAPTGLQILEYLPQATGNGLVELVAWVTTAGAHFVKTQIEGRNEIPRITEPELQQLVAKLQAGQTVLSGLLRGCEQDRVAALNAKAHLVTLADDNHPELHRALHEIDNLLQSDVQDYRAVLQRIAEARVESAAADRERETERAELGGALDAVHGDIQTARDAKEFGETVAEILGVHQAIEVLRGELEAPYGRARRQNAIIGQVSGIQDTESGSRFCSFSKASSVDAWLAGALAWLESNQRKKIVPSPKPVNGSTFTETGNRWFKCPSGHTTRVDKGDWRGYEQGGVLLLSCSICGSQGMIKR